MHEKLCPKLEVLDVGHVFAEVLCVVVMLWLELTNIQAIRRVHHGESISVLFQYD